MNSACGPVYADQRPEWTWVEEAPPFEARSGADRIHVSRSLCFSRKRVQIDISAARPARQARRELHQTTPEERRRSDRRSAVIDPFCMLCYEGSAHKAGAAVPQPTEVIVELMRSVRGCAGSGGDRKLSKVHFVAVSYRSILMKSTPSASTSAYRIISSKCLGRSRAPSICVLPGHGRG